MSVLKNYKKLIQNIKASCKVYNRNFERINLVAVSKQQALEKIKILIRNGHTCFGENRLDEATTKWKDIDKKNIKLHFIGALQSKKVREIIKFFDVIETLDTERAARKLSLLQSEGIKLPQIFIQINIGEEAQKRGVYPSEFSDFLNLCRNKYGLDISGAMCMPPNKLNPNKYFKEMLNICTKEKLDDISMGMSSDYKEAIINGANNIRIGSLLFGEREKIN